MSIKKTILGLFVIGIGVINFSFAGFARNNRQIFNVGLEQGINDGTNNYVEFGNDYSIKFNGSQKFLRIEFGDAYGNPFYASMFWTKDGRFGSVAGNMVSNFQGGYFNKVYVINEDIPSNGDNSVIQGGQRFDYNEYKEIMKGQTVNKITIGRGGSINPGICFHTTNGVNYCFDTPIYDLPDYQQSFGDTPYVNNYEGFLQLYGELIGNSPFSTQRPTTPNINNISCPTIGQIIQAQYKGYEKYMCYGGYDITNIMNQGDSLQGFKAGQGADIFTLYNTYGSGFTNITNWYDTYKIEYLNGNTTPFYGKSKALAGLMAAGKIRQQNTNRTATTNNIILYCDLIINYDENQTTCTLNNTGSDNIQDINITNEDMQELLNNTDRTITSPTTGTDDGQESVFAVLYDGEEEGDGRKRDIAKSMKNIYKKMTGLFYKRSGTDGVIPEELTRILIVILLFKLFKK